MMNKKTTTTDISEDIKQNASDKIETSQSNDLSTVIKNDPEKAPKPKSKNPIKAGLIVCLVILLFITLFSYTIAYEKIGLVKKYPRLQMAVANVVQSIPFAPKTPKFLLTKTLAKHQNVTKQSYEISAVLDSKYIASIFGLTNMDLKAEGAIDYTDPENLLASANLSITKDYNFEFIIKDKIIYIKINKISPLLLAFLGINGENFTPFLNQWLAYDTTPLDSEARKYLEQNKEELSENPFEERLAKYLDDEIYKSMQVSKTEDEGVKFYKITLNADNVLIQHLDDKLQKELNKNQSLSSSQQSEMSDLLENAVLEIYIDKDYFTRKVIASLDLNLNKLTSGSGSDSTLPQTPSLWGVDTSSKLVVALKLGNFGESLDINKPENTKEYASFLAEITKFINVSSPSASLLY